MTGKDEQLDSLFKERMKEAKVVPPVEVWGNISQQLAKKQSRKNVLFFMKLAAGIALILSGFAIYWILIKSPVEQQLVREETILQPKQGEKDKISQENSDPDGNEIPLIIPDQVSPTRDNSENNLSTTRVTNSHAPKNEKVRAPADAKYAARKSISANTVEDIKKDISGLNYTDEHNSPQKVDLIVPNLLAEVSLEEYTIQNKNLAEFNAMAVIHKKTEDKWQMGAFYAPLYSYRMVESANLTSVQDQIIQSSEKGMISYSGGLTVTYTMGRRLKISSGLNVTKMSNSIENIVAYVSHYDDKEMAYADGERNTKVSYQVNNSMGNIQTGEPNAEVSNDPSIRDLSQFSGSFANSLNTAAISNSTEIVQDFTYIELPVMVKYSLIESTIDLNLLTGISSFLMMDNEVSFKNIQGNDVSGKTNNVRNSNFSGSIGLGFAYDMSKSVQLYIDPVFKLFLNSINTSQLINTYPYSFGLYSGISFVF